MKTMQIPVALETLGFEPSYRIGPQSDFPGTGGDSVLLSHGEQACPAIAFGFELHVPDSGSTRLLVPEGPDPERYATGLLATPSPHHLLVVSGGQGYYVDTRHPAKFQAAGVYPIVRVHAVPQYLVLEGLFSLGVYSPDGFAWSASGKDWDELRLVRVGPTMVKGEAFVPSREEWQDFTIELSSGKVRVAR